MTRLSSSDGGLVPDDTTGAASRDRDARTASPSLAVGPSDVPAGASSTQHTNRKEVRGIGTTELMGRLGDRPTSGSADTETPAGTTGCVCGHSRVSHSRYRLCTVSGCLCDRYRKPMPAMNDAAAVRTSDGA